jgi:hypothetical protein
MLEVVFPKFTGQRYYETHFKYVLNIFKAIDCTIHEEERPYFIVTINGKDVLFDYADHSVPPDVDIPTFKFHAHYETEKVFAFPPVSFLNWKEYVDFSTLIKYNARGPIGARQRIYGNAKLRREFVKQKLLSSFSRVRLGEAPQREYFSEAGDTFVAVFVPGFCNNMLDRGQFQYMALGCCTVSPRLPERLPFGKELIPGEHYIVCRDDYSDLIDIIKFYECCREACIEIGENAKSLFTQTSTPEAIGRWIGEKL